MNQPIEAILFDVGGTLRHTVQRTRGEKRAAIQKMMALVDAQGSVDEFWQQISARAQGYKQWAEQTRIELNESDLWTKWMLPDHPAELVGNLAIQLNQLYREVTGQRLVFPETRATLLTLFRNGYRLGLVSNTTSSVEVPALLQEQEISGCFEAVVLSAVVGKRKPDPSILLEAARRMGVVPERCAYVGDRPERDVAAARLAGFTKAIILRDPRASSPESTNDAWLTPDAVIENLYELAEIFPPRPTPRPTTAYKASLSTMYGLKNFPTLNDFFEAARRMGFAHIELNHKVTSAMLHGIDLNAWRFPSIHEPCPADISEEELKKRDWLISSSDETCRAEGVKAIQRSIDLAAQVGTKAIVIHAGHSIPDQGKLEKRLRELLESGQRDTDEYSAIQAQMRQIRARFAPAGFDAVQKSLLELLAYAAPFKICLGLENRYHFLEFPNPDEMETLLTLADPDRIGFIYDSGHAQAMDRLGFYPHQAWLRLAARIVGAHLHDVVGVNDHYAAGLGEVDFDTIAAHLPAGAFRTCEFQSFNTTEQVRAGLQYLAEHGCIQRIREEN